MFISKVFSFFFVCLLAICGNSVLQTENTNQPQQKENAELSLKMERTGCFGTCPTYKLNVQSNGNVLFEGIEYTNIKGKAEGSIDEIKMEKLIAEIDKANFFSLKDSYTNVSDNCPSYGTDQSTVTLYIKVKDKEKTIIHNLGCIEIGRNWKVFPEQLYTLENKIDEIVETKRWIGERK